MTRITVYTRADCKLCEQAEALVVRVAAPHDDVELVDVDADPAITDRYTVRVPVIALDGVEVLELAIDEEQLRGALARARLRG